MFASVLLTTLALFGSVALAAPTVLANTTGFQCGTTMNYDEFLTTEAHFNAHKTPTSRLDTASVIILNVYFHIISQDNTVLGGQIPDVVLANQMDVLNQGFSNTGLSWSVAGVDRWIRPDWYIQSVGSASYQQMKQQLHAGGVADLNVYTIGAFADSFYGYSTFPSQFSSAPFQDGVVIVADTFPGGNLQGNNLGRVLTHEAGHWVGLFHTFENYNSFVNGCYGPGDQVADTPAEATSASGCPIGRNTCANRPGVDPINNYMDYTLDYCRTEFTPGQIDRLRAQIYTYRGIPYN